MFLSDRDKFFIKLIFGYIVVSGLVCIAGGVWLIYTLAGLVV